MPPVGVYQADDFREYSLIGNPFGVIPTEPVQYLSRVEYLPGYDYSAQCKGFLLIICYSVLSAAKQNISVYRTCNPC